MVGGEDNSDNQNIHKHLTSNSTDNDEENKDNSSGQSQIPKQGK